MPLDTYEPTLFERDHGGQGRNLFPVKDDEIPLSSLLPGDCLADDPVDLPNVSEPEVIRHFTKLSRMNFSIDSGFYPLGSCTMKYNPKICDALAELPAFAQLHPQCGAENAQGTLHFMNQISQMLADLAGMKKVTVNPCAGAHGELCGIMMIQAYHKDHGNDRHVVLVPDSAHGTNPATAAMVGYKTVDVASNEEGRVDLDDLKSKLNDDVAALMLTNPNTLGIFEKDILEIAKMVHDAGAMLYYDGANLNAIAGIVRPGDMGFDVVHINLHKTFSTPHGSGGPGSGPVGVNEKLLPYLPTPLLEVEKGKYVLNYDSQKSIGQLSTFFGNVGILLRGYVYMRLHGLEGLKKNSKHAVLNARYLRQKLNEHVPASVMEDCMHEFVLTMRDHDRFGDLNAMVMAKNLIDRGFHAPTVYFPLVVKEAMMIEPTETESMQTLDEFTEAVENIIQTYKTDPDKVMHAPHTLPVKRLDEVKAARQPDLIYQA